METPVSSASIRPLTGARCRRSTSISPSNRSERDNRLSTSLAIPAAAYSHHGSRAIPISGSIGTVTVTSLQDSLVASIRTIPDYPKPGILFRDITTLLGDARAFRRSIDELVHPYAGTKIDKIAGIEARGFILGGAMAHQMSSGFVPIRKKGKLPHETVRIAYSLEYGLDEMEMHKDAVAPGEKVILVDDLIATGGTAEAAVKLLRQIGADIVAACFVIDLPELGGRKKLEALGVDVRTLIAFDGH